MSPHVPNHQHCAGDSTHVSDAAHSAAPPWSPFKAILIPHGYRGGYLESTRRCAVLLIIVFSSYHDFLASLRFIMNNDLNSFLSSKKVKVSIVHDLKTLPFLRLGYDALLVRPFGRRSLPVLRG
jgi:hypothetical protein